MLTEKRLAIGGITGRKRSSPSSHSISYRISRPLLHQVLAPSRSSSSANDTPTANQQSMSPPLSGPANCLTSSPPSTSNPSSTASHPLITSSSTPSSASRIPVEVMQKVVTIPKIITLTSSSGVQRKESCQGSGATKL